MLRRFQTILQLVALRRTFDILLTGDLTSLEVDNIESQIGPVELQALP